jgi:hypothetical protein
MGGVAQVAMRVASQIWQVVFASQTLQVFCLALRKKAQYVVVDFVETHMSNDYIGWFLALKHILKGHVGLWSGLGDFYLVFLELSCVM